MLNLCKCTKCGCTGIHACPGYQLKPWNQAQIKQLEDAIRLIQKRELEIKLNEKKADQEK